MGKIALIGLIVVALVCWLRYKATGRSHNSDPVADRNGDVDTMVSCARCGVHLPRAEALPGASGNVYCDASHRALAQDDPA